MAHVRRLYSLSSKKTLIWSSHFPKTLNALFVQSESVLGFGLTMFVLDFFWLREGEQPTWCFTQHLSYHFWMWRWFNNLELILPLYITFLQRWTVTSRSLCITHSTSGSVVLFSFKTHHLCSYSLMLWNLTCLWSVHTLSVGVHVFLMCKWWYVMSDSNTASLVLT